MHVAALSHHLTPPDLLRARMKTQRRSFCTRTSGIEHAERQECKYLLHGGESANCAWEESQGSGDPWERRFLLCPVRGYPQHVLTGLVPAAVGCGVRRAGGASAGGSVRGTGRVAILRGMTAP